MEAAHYGVKEYIVADEVECVFCGVDDAGMAAASEDDYSFSCGNESRIRIMGREECLPLMLQARKRSSAMSSSENQSFSSGSYRTAFFRPVSYGVSRGISPEIKNMSSRTVCAWFDLLTTAPASVSSSKVGSASRDMMFSGRAIPR